MTKSAPHNIPRQNATRLSTAPLQEIHAICAATEKAVAALGKWPVHIDTEKSLTARIPQETAPSSGFDAGLATALGLIPPHAATLTATLHAAYTPAAVEQVRAEINKTADGSWQVKNADSAACWWLAACSLCIEGDDIDEKTFRGQLQGFQKLMQDPAARLAAANNALNAMVQSFDTWRGYAFGTADGAMQGAYITGHDIAVLHHQARDIYFIGTFRPSLGLENFPFAAATDEKGRPTSGPVHGSKQFVKCAGAAELQAAMESVKKHFSRTPASTKPPRP